VLVCRAFDATLIFQNILEMMLGSICGRDVGDIQNRIHLLVEEHNLIVLSDNDTIMIDFNKIFKHL
jgi:hypothetical protein